MRAIWLGVLSVMVCGMMLAPLPATIAQTPDVPRYEPRFSTGAAIIQRPISDYYFTAYMTTDNQHVVGMSTQTAEAVYVWAIGDLADTIIIPTPQAIDLTPYLPTEIGVLNANLLRQDDRHALIQLDAWVVRVDILNLAVVDAVQFADTTPLDNRSQFGGLAVHGDKVAVLYEAVNQVKVWDTASGDIAERSFGDLTSIRAFDDGWVMLSRLPASSTTSTIYHCTLDLATCQATEIQGTLAMQLDDMWVFGDSNPYSVETTIPTTYYRWVDFNTPLEPMASPFPYLPWTFEI